MSRESKSGNVHICVDLQYKQQNGILGKTECTISMLFFFNHHFGVVERLE